MTMLNKDLLHFIKTLSTFGVWAVIDEKNKEIDIIATSNISRSVGAYIQKEPHILKLDLLVLETCSSFEIASVYSSLWYDYYESLGYTVRKNKRRLSRYKKYTELVRYKNLNRIAIYLKNKRGNIVILGIFDTLSEADSFDKVLNSGSTPVLRLLSANNELTKEYYLLQNKNKYNMIQI